MAGERNLGHTSGACRDIYDYEMEHDGDEYTQSYSQTYSQSYEDDDEDSITSINMNEQLNILKAECAQPEGQQVAVTGVKENNQSPFSSFKAPALPREVQAEATVTPTTTSTITVEPTLVAPIKTKSMQGV